MADVTVPEDHWSGLKGSANCYVPQGRAFSFQDKYTQTDVHDVSKAAGFRNFSVQLIGKVMRLNAVKHEKAEQFIAAYKLLHAKRTDLGDPKDMTIVAAIFGIPKLGEYMKAASLDVAALSLASNVSHSAIEHALDKGRVTGGIASALHDALGKVPPLPLFCSSRAIQAVGRLSLAEENAFTLSDLSLPLPKNAPAIWP
ncbi:hypothetical protein [Caulobacter sp. FWC26]|uniref:hypothetical protein n=1 Tax=Caulobacter sp. FWC26 TaxID=69665 RepID=UPI000C1595F8|nr:hypothetical protein [Caulobacter sp. FWC26]AZS19400.1 hypothetical protein CSW63_01365 [Caulobacter sp. FWC26]